MGRRVSLLALCFLMGASSTALAAGDGADTASKSDRVGHSLEEIAPQRFGKVTDDAYGAYQRGLYLTALKLALPRAEKGEASAQTLVAEIYARGLGVPRDGNKAAEWYGKAAAQKDPAAEFQYALMLLDGTFVEKDPDRAFSLMKDAAESGNHLAQFNLAQLILERDRTPEGAKKAVGFYERAAQAGLADAEYAMAEAYANGIGGMPHDDAQARKWLARAAHGNYDTAQLELGTWLVDGRGGARNYKAGFSWLQRAAYSGNVAAQNRLAKLYRSGVGTDADPVRAAAWYVLAHRAGLVDPEMDDFMDGLTDDQRKQAIEQANRLR